MYMKKSIAVLGLGKYGCSLAEKLYELGEDVLVADMDDKIIREMSPKVTTAIRADLSSEEEVATLGLQNMDIVVVCTGGNIAASVLCTAIAKEKGVQTVIAKASSTRMKKVLKRVGADRIIDPEQEGGIRSARILASRHIQNYYELDDNLCMVELRPRSSWVGKSLIELNLRQKHGLNIAAIKDENEKWAIADPSYILKEEDLLLIIIEKKAIDSLN